MKTQIYILFFLLLLVSCKKTKIAETPICQRTFPGTYHLTKVEQVAFSISFSSENGSLINFTSLSSSDCAELILITQIQMLFQTIEIRLQIFDFQEKFESD